MHDDHCVLVYMYDLVNGHGQAEMTSNNTGNGVAVHGDR